MRKFLTILSFCFIFTILYSNIVFAKADSFDFSLNYQWYGTPDIFSYRTDLTNVDSFYFYDFSEDGYSFYSNGRNYNGYLVLLADSTEPLENLSVVQQPIFSSLGISSYSFGGVTKYIKVILLSNYPSFHLFDSIDGGGVDSFCRITQFDYDGYIVSNLCGAGDRYMGPRDFSYCAKSAYYYLYGLGVNPMNNPTVIQTAFTDPIPSSDLDFKNLQYTTGSPKAISGGDSFISKFSTAVINGAFVLADKLHFYNQPYMATRWSNPPYENLNGYPVQYTITEYGHITVTGKLLGGIKKTFVDTDAEVVVLDNVTLNHTVFHDGALDFYNPDFDDKVSTYAMSHIDNSLLNSFLLNESFNVNEKFSISKIKLQARCVIDNQEYYGAPTYIDYSSGSPVVHYGVTIDDTTIEPDLLDGDWSYDVDNDYDVTSDGDGNYTYNTTNNNTYNYNYNYGDNHYDTDGFISSFWSIIKSVGTLLGRLSAYLSLIFLGAGSVGTVFAPIFLLIGLAVGIAVAMRIIEIISGG